jgi:uncharacterized damage-inducible protein DinB
MAREAVVQTLVDTLCETLRFFELPAETLNKSYAPGKWNARELLIHISDCETVLLDRLRRLASEEKPVLQAFDENLWVKGLFYARRDLALARQQFEVARRNVLELARTLDASVDAKTGVHSEAGTRKFGDVLAHLAEHNAHHLEQVRAIAAGKTWTKK